MPLPASLLDFNNKLILVTPGLIRRKPGFLIRVLLRTLFQNLYLRRTGPLQSVLFHTHYKCNLSCSHCYEKKFKQNNEKPLTLAEKKQIISECLNLGAISFDFVSGESSLDPDLPELVQACRPERTYITLATNGYDYTEEKVKSFLEMGIDKMNISIDSWYPDEHNAIRGKQDSHHNAFQTIEYCKKAGMAFHITTFVYKDSTKTDGFQKLVEYAIQHRIRTTFKAAVPLGAWEGRHDTLITDEDRELLFALHKKYPFLVRTCIGTKESTCPAFNKMVAITAYGDVLPCNAVHISFGNVKEESLRTIVDRGRRIEYFNGTCKGCPPAEDMHFIEMYLSKTYQADHYPEKAEQVFPKTP